MTSLRAVRLSKLKMFRHRVDALQGLKTPEDTKELKILLDRPGSQFPALHRL